MSAMTMKTFVEKKQASILPAVFQGLPLARSPPSSKNLVPQDIQPSSTVRVRDLGVILDSEL